MKRLPQLSNYLKFCIINLFCSGRRSFSEHQLGEPF